MAALSTSQCYAHAAALRGRVVVITGAGGGFGRALAVEYARLGAKIVAGDVDTKGLEGTRGLVEKANGEIVTAKCDVRSWDEQVALFAAGFAAFGAIDIVLPNAGVNELGRFDPRLDDTADAAAPVKPDLRTLDIDLVAVLYTTRIAMWYFSNDKREAPGPRTVCFTGSMSTWFGANFGVMYSVSKAGLLGILKGSMDSMRTLDARAVMVCPYFTKTGILDADFVHPNPKLGYCKLEDVVAAFVAAVTDPDPAHDFGAWLIPDQWGVVRMEATGMRMGAEGARRPRGTKL